MNRATLVFAALLAALLPLSLLAGRVWIDPLAGTNAAPNAALILMELRLPRAALAVVIAQGWGVETRWLGEPGARACNPGLAAIAKKNARGGGADPSRRAFLAACAGPRCDPKECVGKHAKRSVG